MSDWIEWIEWHGTVREKFWAKVRKAGPDECWPWTGGFSRSYGSFYVRGLRTHRTNRIAWLMERGSIPEGMVVCHSCDNPACCNPSHLWVGTTADNNRDRTSKGRSVRPPRDETAVNYQRGERHADAKLTEALVREMRSKRSSGSKLLELAKQFGVTESTVGYICRRKLWKHVM